MSKSIIELIIGSLDEKRAYRQFMKRVNALPKDYRFAFQKIQHYIYNCDLAGCDITMFTDLVELFETSASQGKPIFDVIGSDVSGFCDELVSASAVDAITSREKLNQEIQNHFHRERK